MASFAAAVKSPDKSIPLLKKIITGTLSYNDQTFNYAIYPNPHNQEVKIKNKLIEIFGNRIQKGKKCLGIVVSGKEAINIDNKEDLIIANHL